MAHRPNLLFLICHDLGRFLPVYGEATAATPHLDRLAERSLRFDNYFCTAPQCSPSRGSIYTGRYPHVNGLWGLVNGGWRLPASECHLAAVLRDGGYRTALIGHQHEHPDPAQLGYDEVHAVPGARAREVGPRAAAWLREQAAAGPFYLNVGIFEPHRPYDAPGYEPDPPDRVRVPPYLPDTAEVRAEVRAERIVDVGNAVVVAPQRQVLPEVLQRDDLTDLHVARPRDLEPAIRDGER